MSGRPYGSSSTSPAVASCRSPRAESMRPPVRGARVQSWSPRAAKPRRAEHRLADGGVGGLQPGQHTGDHGRTPRTGRLAQGGGDGRRTAPCAGRCGGGHLPGLDPRRRPGRRDGRSRRARRARRLRPPPHGTVRSARRAAERRQPVLERRVGEGERDTVLGDLRATLVRAAVSSKPRPGRAPDSAGQIHAGAPPRRTSSAAAILPRRRRRRRPAQRQQRRGTVGRAHDPPTGAVPPRWHRRGWRRPRWRRPRWRRPRWRRRPYEPPCRHRGRRRYRPA